jgi:hypothetical protein
LEASGLETKVHAYGNSWQASIGRQSVALTNPGTLATGTGAVRFYFAEARLITNIVANVGTAPTGASVIVDVNKNGTTLFTTQANRPTIAASAFADTASVPDVVTVAAGDYITVDIDQVGSTVAGADLVVTVYFS